MNASIVDLRYRMKEVMRAIDRGETVTVFYRGKQKAKLVPLDQEEKPKMRLKDHPAVGMWKDREDMKDPAAFVRNLRKPRYRDI